MTIFLIVFFLYLLLRYYFRERQKRAGNIYMVGSRFGLLPDHVRAISIVGMAGIALIIVIVSIMGYQLTPDQIAYMLTLGIVIMSVQYLPLFIIGENGFVSVDSQVNWKDVVSARVQNRKIGGSAQIHLGYQSEPGQSSIDIYIHSDQVKDFEKILTELTQVQLENPEV
jgi:small-conductance mechanosensitive channel